MSKKMPSWLKNALIFGGMSVFIILCNEGCKPLQNLKNKKAEKEQAEYNEIYNKAYNDAYTQISKKIMIKKRLCVKIPANVFSL